MPRAPSRAALAMLAIGDAWLTIPGALDGGAFESYKRFCIWLAEQVGLDSSTPFSAVASRVFDRTLPPFADYQVWHWAKTQEIERGEIEIVQVCRCSHGMVMHHKGPCLAGSSPGHPRCDCPAWDEAPALRVINHRVVTSGTSNLGTARGSRGRSKAREGVGE